MAISRRSSRSRFTLLLLVLTSITAITLDFRGDAGLVGRVRETAIDAFAPVRSGAEKLVAPISDTFNGIRRYGRLEEQNAQLRDRIAELERRDLEMDDALRERAELLDLLDLDFASDIPQVSARVVSAPVSNFELTVEIDRGRKHGVAVDMPVVSGAGLVGRVVRVTDGRSLVLLLSDPTSSVGVRLARSGDVGVAQGAGRGEPLTVDFIDVRTDVRRREPVITSGLQNSIFPPSIPIGRVESAETDSGSLQQTVRVEPAVDLDRLVFVKVLQWRPEG